jgi:hypothetical protein
MGLPAIVEAKLSDAAHCLFDLYVYTSRAPRHTNWWSKKAIIDFTVSYLFDSARLGEL